jgi:predicted NUDIX family phosphoesterase
MTVMEEEVLVFPASVMKSYDFEGFHAYTPAFKNLLSDIREASIFMPRSQVENDPSLLQPIPYAYVYGWKPGALVYERTKSGNESRLHSRYSIGVGGHINPEDNKGGNIFTMAATREIREEFNFTGDSARSPQPSDFNIRGFIRRTDTPVSSVHFGVVYAFASPTETVEAASADIAVVGWRTLDQLRQPDIYDRLEDWSKEVVDFLIR